METCKVWAEAWQNTQIHIFCDNMAVVEVLSTFKARDRVLVMCARNILLISAIHSIHLKVTHRAGKKNSLADLLSRWTGREQGHLRLTTMCPNAP